MKTVKAYVSIGTWVAECPQCGGAEIVRMDQPFVCRGVVKAGFHGEQRACGFTADVEFPAEKLQIETLLTPRPEPARNWHWGVSLQELADENAEHGLKG